MITFRQTTVKLSLWLFMVAQISLKVSACSESCDYPATFTDQGLWQLVFGSPTIGATFSADGYTASLGSTSRDYTCAGATATDNVHVALVCGASGRFCDRNIINEDGNLIMNNKITEGIDESSTIDDCVSAFDGATGEENSAFWQDSLLSTTPVSCGLPTGDYFMSYSDSTGENLCSTTVASGAIIDDTTITIQNCDDEGTAMMYTCVSSFTADQLQDSETGDFIVATYEDSSRIAVLRWLVEDNNVMLNVASDANDLASYVVSDTPVSFFGEVRDGLSYTSYAFFPKGVCGFPPAFTEPESWWAMDIDHPLLTGPIIYRFLPDQLLSFSGPGGNTPNPPLSHDCSNESYEENNRHYVITRLNNVNYCQMHQSINNIIINDRASVGDDVTDASTCPAAITAEDPITFNAYISSPFDTTTESPFETGVYTASYSYPGGPEDQCEGDITSTAEFGDSFINITSCDDTSTYLTPYSGVFNIVGYFSATELDLDSSDGDFVILSGPEDAFYFARYKMNGDETAIDLTLAIPPTFRQCVWHSSRPAGEAFSQSIVAANGQTNIYQYMNFHFERDADANVGFTSTGDLNNLTDAQQEQFVDQLTDQIVNATGIDPDRLNITLTPGSVVVTITISPGAPGEMTAAEVAEIIADIYDNFVLVDEDGNVLSQAINGTFVNFNEAESTTMAPESDHEETTMAATTSPSSDEHDVTTEASDSTDDTETTDEHDDDATTQPSDTMDDTEVTEDPDSVVEATTVQPYSPTEQSGQGATDVPDSMTTSYEFSDPDATSDPDSLEGGEHIDLRFEDSYASVVKPDEDQFNADMTEQLAEIANITTDRLIVQSEPGSIILGIDILSGTNPTARVAADRIREAFNSGEMNLVAPDGTVLAPDFDFFVQYTLTGACILKPCENQGICTALSDGSHVCDCLSGFSGDDCEDEDLMELTILLIIVITFAVFIILVVCVCVCVCQCNRREPAKLLPEEEDDISKSKHGTAWRSDYLKI